MRYLTYLCFTERLPPPTGSVLVACEIQDGHLPSYRWIPLDTFPSGRERVQPFDPDRKRGEVRARILVQRRELTLVEGRVRGCTWGVGDDFRCAGDRVFGGDF